MRAPVIDGAPFVDLCLRATLMRIIPGVVDWFIILLFLLRGSTEPEFREKRGDDLGDRICTPRTLGEFRALFEAFP